MQGLQRRPDISKLIFIFVILGGLLLPQHGALAHSGPLDSDGCHRGPQTLAGHCHSPREESEWESGTVIVLAGMLVVLLAVELFDHVTAGIAPLKVSPYLGEDLEAGVVAEYSLGDTQHFGIRAVTRSNDRSEDVRASAYWRVGF